MRVWQVDYWQLPSAFKRGIHVVTTFQVETALSVLLSIYEELFVRVDAPRWAHLVLKRNRFLAQTASDAGGTLPYRRLVLIANELKPLHPLFSCFLLLLVPTLLFFYCLGFINYWIAQFRVDFPFYSKFEIMEIPFKLKSYHLSWANLGELSPLREDRLLNRKFSGLDFDLSPKSLK